jgi:hypothetical protein
MADQNLLNDDDFFSKAMKSEKDEPKDNKEKVYSEEDDLFKPKAMDEQSAEELAYIESSLQERSDFPSDIKSQSFEATVEDKKPNVPIDKPTPQADFSQTPVPKQGDLNYKQVYFDMDEVEQEKVSYKPFFITFLIIIILGAGGYFAYDLYLKDKFFSKFSFLSDQQPEQTVVAEEPEQVEQEPLDIHNQQSELERQKSVYLTKVTSQTNQEVTSIANVIAISRKSTKLSSILLYDSDFILEVFGKSQQDLARLNNELKSSNSIQNLKVVSSSERIGANSGLLGVYSAKLKLSGSADRQVTLNLAGNAEAGNWLRDILTKNKLKVKNYKNRSTKTQDLFKVHEIEAVANGSINSCLNVLNAIATAGTNVKLYKLTCSAVDQTNFGTANYQLKLVLKVYI